MQGGYERMCRHAERGINLDKLSSQLFKSKLNLFQCEDCVNDLKAGVGKEGRGRSSHKKAARLTDSAHQEGKWVCLACGHVSCGTLSDNLNVDGKAQLLADDEIRAPTSGHAWKHSVCTRHPLALQAGDNLVSWCFICNMPVEYHPPRSTQDPSQLSNSLQGAAEVVRGKLSKKKGFLKDPARMCYPMEPVRCVIDTVKCVFDSAAHAKACDAANSNPSVSMPFIGLRKKRAVKGLMNLGNTCFFNSVMQNLLALDMLQDHFNQEAQDSEGPLTTSLRYLYQEVNSKHVPMTSLNACSYEYGLKRSWRGATMWASSERVCNPSVLFDAICAKAPRFRGFQQQDSHELLRCLLEGLHSEEQSAKFLLTGDVRKVISSPLSKLLGQNGHDSNLESAEEDGEHGNSRKEHSPQVSSTFVESVFGGQLSSTVQCCECGHIAVMHETMLDLSLQIPARQILKKRLACENPGVLSFYGGRSEKGSLYEESRSSKPAPMTIAHKTTYSSTLLPKESNDCFLVSCLSAQADRINTLGPDVAESSKVTFGDKSTLHDFTRLHFDRIEMNLEEGSLQKPFDIPYHADNRSTLFVDAVDCIPGGALKAEMDHSKCEGSINLCGMKEVDMQWHMDSVSADGVLSETLQNERKFVEKFSTNACEMLQDKDVLGQSKDKCAMSQITLPLYKHPEVTDFIIEEKTSQITRVAAECNISKYSCTEDKGPNIQLEAKEAHEASPQLLQGAEILSFIDQEMEAPIGHMEGVKDTEKTLVKFTGEVDSAAFDETKVAAGPEEVSNPDDDVLPLSLEACLADFTKLELLCGDNAWECENCSRLARGKVNALALDDHTKTREDNSSTEVGEDIKDPNENGLEKKDEKYILLSSASSCNSNQSKVSVLNQVEANGLYQACQNADILMRASSGIIGGDCSSSATTDHDEEQTYHGCANSTAVVGAQHDGGDCFRLEVDNKHGSILHTLDDTSNGDQRTKLGIEDFNNHDKIGGSQSSLAGKSVTPYPSFRKHLPNLRKEKLSFFSVFFSKTENHRAMIEQQQNLAKRNATKKLLVIKPPLILTVHLKRFAQDAGGRFNKLCGHVAFSEFLDLRPYLDPRCLDHDNCSYRLMGIVEHGGTMRSGHYVAYVRGPCVEESIDFTDQHKDSWYSISDSRVYQTTLQDVLGREAYLLFYERCSAEKSRGEAQRQLSQ